MGYSNKKIDEYDDEDEVSLSVIFAHIFNHFLLIVLIVMMSFMLASSYVGSKAELDVLESETKTVEDEEKQEKIVYLAFVALGIVVGVVTALSIGFNDRHIYSSKRLKEITGDSLISSIPLYRKPESIDSREYAYISEKLALKKGDKLSIFSLSSKAGCKTIAEGLGKECEAEVENLQVFKDNPKMIDSLRTSSCVLVVLRAGIDNVDKVEKIIDDFRVLGIENYFFVLNAVDKTDSNTIRYLSRSNYRSHLWLLESWWFYYRRNY